MPEASVGRIRGAQNWADGQIHTGKVPEGKSIGHTHIKESAGYKRRHIVPAFKARTPASLRSGDIEVFSKLLLGVVAIALSGIASPGASLQVVEEVKLDFLE